MATADASAAIRVPGRLIKSPTSLSGSAPYGGTDLGLVRMARWRDGFRVERVRAEEWGGQAVNVVQCGRGCALAAILRGYDSDAVTALFPGVSAGASSGRPVYAQTLTTEAHRPGRRLDESAHVLLFAPLAPATHPAVLIYAAVPVPEEAAEVSLSLDADLEIGAVWHGVPDDDGRTFAVGLLEDLEL